MLNYIKYGIVSLAAILGFSAHAENWNGIYYGIGSGVNSIDIKVSRFNFSKEENGKNVFLGYRHSFGNFVTGTEISSYFGDTADVSDAKNISITTGFDLGEILPYMSYGISEFELKDKSYSIPFVGYGIDFSLSDNVIFGVNVTKSKFQDKIRNYDVFLKTEKISFRIAYKF